jgi:ribonuclease BN (tRNA processing enzyme)
MKFTVLGSGTAVPHPKRRGPGFWLETSGGNIVLDFSMDVPRQMLDLGLDWPDLDVIWISHFHLDHMGGLAPFLFGTRHAPEVQDRKKPLRIFGPSGLEHLLKKFNDAYNYKLFDQPFPVEIVEVDPLDKFEMLEGVASVAMKTPHTGESLAIHLRDAHGSTFVYTGDTGFSDVIGTFARNVDLLVIESSYVKDKDVEIHLELAEAMHIVRKAAPKRAVLTHLYPYWDGLDFGKEVAKYSPGCEVIEATDGLTIELKAKN